MTRTSTGILAARRALDMSPGTYDSTTTSSLLASIPRGHPRRPRFSPLASCPRGHVYASLRRAARPPLAPCPRGYVVLPLLVPAAPVVLRRARDVSCSRPARMTRMSRWTCPYDDVLEASC
ncbi:hypothetical protein [Nannocystis pusilla]|uniref:hypothetical protein n=1 Tax=Nannocystis pusilla TaxID=889268 RepID=UPI003B7CB6CB